MGGLPRITNTMRGVRSKMIDVMAMKTQGRFAAVRVIWYIYHFD